MPSRSESAFGNNSPDRGLAASDVGPGRKLSRRRFLRAGALTAGGLVLSVVRALRAAPVDPPAAGAKFVGLEPFEDEQAGPAGELIGTELDGRLFTDLSKVSNGRVVTPTAEFFIRSAASKLLPDAGGWKIGIDGMVEQTSTLGVDALRKAARPMGTHLMECAGNVALTRFGLIGVADWTGVPVPDVLGEAKRRAGAAWVEISGFDEYSQPSRTSTPGASWIFPVDALKGAFLATEMNGRMLTRDHGCPVRLVIPGWYGAACIKWVNRITFVEGGAEASSQMQEYAVRTLQGGRPQFARDYQPATVDHAALPVRVEKWIAGGKVQYRIVGIAWGGPEPVAALKIRFNAEEEFVPVPGFRPVKTDPWTIWTYTWKPSAPGVHRIRMAVAGPRVRARKLDLGLYDRTVHISEI
jgi:DMSO/TMAO reductase YedYZ molybdopterin-dependent catalytic subunit